MRRISLSIVITLLWGASSTFAIGDTLSLTSPDGGEIFHPYQMIDVCWEGTSQHESLLIELSLDGGKTWPIKTRSSANCLPNIGTPYFLSDSCLIRITRDQPRNLQCYVESIPITGAIYGPRTSQILTLTAFDTIVLRSIAEEKKQSFLTGHLSPVNWGAFSPTEDLIATAGNNNLSYIINGLTGELKQQLQGHTGTINFVEFSPDGRTMITASEDSTARIWAVESGQIIYVLRGHKGGLMSASFSPDGERVITAGKDQTAMIWSARTGKVLDTLIGHSNTITGALYSPDGKTILTTSLDQTGRLWDAAQGTLLFVLGNQGANVWRGSFSPDGKRVVTPTAGSYIHIWNVQTGELARSNNLDVGTITSAMFVDSSHIITASTLFNRGLTNLWYIPDSIEVVQSHYYWSIEAFKPRILLPDSNATAVAGSRVWIQWEGIESGERVSLEYSINGGREWNAITEPADHACWNYECYWNIPPLESENCLLRLTRPHTAIRHRVFFPTTGMVISSPDREGYALITGNNHIEMISRWPDVNASYTDTAALINEIAYSPDGKTLAAACSDGFVKFLDSRTLSSTASMKIAGVEHLTSLDYGADSRHLAVVGSNHRIYIVDPTSRQVLHVLSTGEVEALTVRYNQVGDRIITTGTDSVAVLWNAETGMPLDTLRAHRNELIDARFSPDGKFVLTTSRDSTGILWDITADSIRYHYRHSHSIYHPAFNSNGHRVVIPGDHSSLTIWSTETGEKIAEQNDGATIHWIVNATGTEEYGLTDGTTFAMYILPDTNLTTVSEHPWSIIRPSVHVRVPNGGETLPAGTTVSLEWDGMASDPVLLQYSTDNGGTWKIIANAVTGNLYHWVVPELASNQCLLRVQSAIPTNARPLSEREITHSVRSPDSRYLTSVAYNSSDSVVVIYDLQTGAAIRSFLPSSPGTQWVAYSPDGSIMAWTANNQVTLINTSNWEFIGQLVGHTGKVQSIRFSRDGKKIITAAADKTAIIWDAENRTILKRLNGHTNTVTSADIDSSGTTVVTAGADFTVRIWDAETGVVRHTLLAHTAEVNDAVFSPDYKNILSTSRDGTARLWNTEDGSLLFTINHGNAVWYGTFNTTGTLVVTPDAAGIVHVWGVNSGVIENTFKAQSIGSRAVQFARNDSTIIIAGSKGIVSYNYPLILPQDISDKSWRIILPTLTLLIPNGGETYHHHDTVPIWWSGMYENDLAQISFSSDNGTSWYPITEEGEGYRYDWIAPDTITSNHCLIKVRQNISSSAPIEVRPENLPDTTHRTSTRVIVSQIGMGINHQITVRDTVTGVVLFETQEAQPIRQTFLSSDESLLLVIGPLRIHVWDITSGQLLSTIVPKQAFLYGVLSTDGKSIVLVTDQSVLTTWSLPDGNLLGKIRIANLKNTQIPLAPDKESIVAFIPGGQAKSYKLPLLLREDISDAVWTLDASSSASDDNSLSSKDQKSDIWLILRPNLVMDRVQIHGGGMAAQNFDITVVDMQGRIILTWQEELFSDSSQFATAIDCSKLPSGIYRCLLHSGDHVVGQNFIVLH